MDELLRTIHLHLHDLVKDEVHITALPTIWELNLSNLGF